MSSLENLHINQACDIKLTNDDKRKLIEMVKQIPDIYNENSKKNHSSEWIKISMNLGDKCQLATKICWQYLRAQFRKEYKTYMEGKPVVWKYFEQLRFLEEYINQNKKGIKTEIKEEISPEDEIEYISVLMLSLDISVDF